MQRLCGLEVTAKCPICEQEVVLQTANYSETLCAPHGFGKDQSDVQWIVFSRAATLHALRCKPLAMRWVPEQLGYLPVCMTPEQDRALLR